MLLRPPASLLPTSATSRSLFPPSSTAGGQLPVPRRRPDRLGLVSFGTQRLAGFSRASPPARPSCCSAASSEDAATGVDRETSVGGREASAVELSADEGREGAELSVAVGSPSISVPLGAIRMSLGDQAFFVLAFIACTTSVAFISLVVALIPTLFAIKRAAISLAKLADTAREELPTTMGAIRLSGMEISDLTMELSDLSQEIADGVNKSAQAVQAAEAGIRKIGDLARVQTMSFIEERASLPDISFEPVVAGAARKTSHVVGQVRKTFLNIISRGGYSSDSEIRSDRVEN